MRRKLLAMLLSLALTVSIFSGCASNTATNAVSSGTQSAGSQKTQVKAPKYVFLFIGDGMSHVQVNATQVYLGDNKSGEVKAGDLSFTKFPVAGVATTYDATSFCPDSASTGTAISSGIKTHSGVLGLAVDKKTKPENITEKLKKAGYKVGIVTTVSIDHATPAAFYAHIDSRSKYYEIGKQMAESNVDYFAGGTFLEQTGKEKNQQDLLEILKGKGYSIADTKEKILALDGKAGKVYAPSPVLQDSKAMSYTIDAKQGDITLADYVKKGIDVLDNDKGFFMMCESGKIDWACHANDAMSAIQDIVGLDKAVQTAVDFAAKHADETLILVTGDHETGGMTIGYAATGYNTAFNILSKQKMSYVAFDSAISKMKEADPALTLEKVLPVIKENFGLIAPTDADASVEANKLFVLSSSEFEKLKNAFAETMKPKDQRAKDDQSALLYGTYEPLSVTLTHIINNKAGIGWTSYAHTGTPVPVYATGANAQTFNGSYDDTDIFKKLIATYGL